MSDLTRQSPQPIDDLIADLADRLVRQYLAEQPANEVAQDQEAA